MLFRCPSWISTTIARKPSSSRCSETPWNPWQTKTGNYPRYLSTRAWSLIADLPHAGIKCTRLLRFTNSVICPILAQNELINCRRRVSEDLRCVFSTPSPLLVQSNFKTSLTQSADRGSCRPYGVFSQTLSPIRKLKTLRNRPLTDFDIFPMYASFFDASSLSKIDPRRHRNQPKGVGRLPSFPHCSRPVSSLVHGPFIYVALRRSRLSCPC